MKIENSLNDVEIACLQPDINSEIKDIMGLIISPISCPLLTKNSVLF